MTIKNMMTAHLWYATKAILRGKFLAIQSYLRKQEKSQINILTYKKATRERRTKPKLVEGKQL